MSTFILTHDIDSLTLRSAFLKNKKKNKKMPKGSGVAKGGPSRARPDQSPVVPYQMMLDCLPLYTLSICTYR